MSGAQAHHDFIASSSSSHSPAANTPPSADDRDELDFLDNDEAGLQDVDFDARRQSQGQRGSVDDNELFDDDPIHGDLGHGWVSSQSRQKPSFMSAPGRFLSSLTGGLSSGQGQSGSSTPLGSGSRGHISPERKDAQAAHDWNTEGPGRRVGYEDLTAIDWIFEYTKERQRLRLMDSSSSGLVGYAQHLLDASQVWIILLLTGISVGAIAAFINIASDWLSDLKLGYCSSGPEGGHFYLNKGFCCYGYDAGYECDGWKTWGEAVGISAASGRWIVEYIFYLIIAVSPEWQDTEAPANLVKGDLGVMCFTPGSRVRHSCEAQWYPRNQDHPRWFRHQAIAGRLDTSHEVPGSGTSTLMPDASVNSNDNRSLLWLLVCG